MNEATLRWISGPVLRARTEAPFQVNEAVLVGGQQLLGEVIQLAGDEIVVQVYEDTTGLEPGARVEGTGSPLSVRLGPALLGRIFDGLLRPLGNQGRFVSPGMRPGSDVPMTFRARVERGEVLQGGALLGEVEAAGARQQHCLVPPGLEGEVVELATDGEYGPDDTVCRLGTAAGVVELSMSHRWPVRVARPVGKRLPADRPLLTGQRILDTLFPVARGGRAALPGGFGTGKTVLQQTLCKWSDADVVVYVGCGERGNEMAEVLQELPELDDPRTGRRLLERTVIIANTSNMPVAAREASIYTGVTVAEYFRDQGLSVALMADSTSRWAEALREISGRLGELPAESGYPAYLSSRLAEFYERAGRVQTLSGAEGSLTIVGAVSPPGGDFSEPVTKHTERYVRCLWSLDPARAHARIYPAIHPLASYSEDVTRSRRGGSPRATRAGSSTAGGCSGCSRIKRGSSAWRASSARTRCRRAAAAGTARGRARQRRFPQPVGAVARRRALLAGAPGRNAQADRALRGPGRAGARARRAARADRRAARARQPAAHERGDRRRTDRSSSTRWRASSMKPLRASTRSSDRAS